ncbi:MAG: deoxyribose-phosphate aldolase [Desulfovibrionaceae bacterium]|nr:deoxyribose-phosphate aldolase [Desulfovibrionaceae bacterium]MDD4951978.1 deoxyribose-phosphate aldolase [Desulfovibrionaceae bacterium]
MTRPRLDLPSTPAQAAAFIEHTLLRPEASAADVERLCQEALRFGFRAVCLNPWHVSRAAALLAGQGPFVVSVAGFPLGAGLSRVKALEAAEAVRQGAFEVDMVMNIGALKSGDAAAVARDIEAVVRAVAPCPVKVILETCLLDDREKVLACGLAEQAGAAFVKTSTGFARAGASVADVALLRAAAGPKVGIKASGGIRTFEQVLALLRAGAERIGASAGPAIVRG